MSEKPEKQSQPTEVRNDCRVPAKTFKLREGYAAPVAPPRTMAVPTAAKPMSAVQGPAKKSDQ